MLSMKYRTFCADNIVALSMKYQTFCAENIVAFGILSIISFCVAHSLPSPIAFIPAQLLESICNLHWS